MRAALLVASSLALAACGGDTNESAVLNVETEAQTNRIAHLAVLDKNEAAVEAPVKSFPLDPVTFNDADRALESGAGCELTHGDSYLLVAVEGDAIAKVDGRIVHLTSDGLNGSGGFFKSDLVTISVGRTSDQSVVRGEAARWPVEVAIRRTGADRPVRMEGYWRCGA